MHKNLGQSCNISEKLKRNTKKMKKEKSTKKKKKKMIIKEVQVLK